MVLVFTHSLNPCARGGGLAEVRAAPRIQCAKCTRKLDLRRRFDIPLRGSAHFSTPDTRMVKITHQTLLFIHLHTLFHAAF